MMLGFKEVGENWKDCEVIIDLEMRLAVRWSGFSGVGILGMDFWNAANRDLVGMFRV